MMDEPETTGILLSLLTAAMAAPDPIREAERMTRGLACGACAHPEPWQAARSMLLRVRAAPDGVEALRGELEALREGFPMQVPGR